MNYETIDPQYDFQSARWEVTGGDDAGKVVVVERSAGPQHVGEYKAVIIDPDDETENEAEPAEVLANNVSEREADKAAREWLMDR